ncbi:MAG: DNA/RNA nuclease SfsA [bacterium]
MNWAAPLVPAVFVSRQNRFAAQARINGDEVACHVPNPSHLRDLLDPGARVFLLPATGDHRKLQYDLVAVQCPRGLVSVDTRVPNRLFVEGFVKRSFAEFSGDCALKPEIAVGRSRLDFELTAPLRRGPVTRGNPRGMPRRTLVEVKSCTLARDGFGYFPDPASERASRHMNELANAARRGLRAFVFFLMQRMDASALVPNDSIDPEFGRAFRRALKAGVEARAFRCRVSMRGVELAGPVEILT